MRKLVLKLHLRWLRWLAADAQYNVDVVCQEIATGPRRLQRHTLQLTRLMTRISALERQL